MKTRNRISSKAGIISVLASMFLAACIGEDPSIGELQPIQSFVPTEMLTVDVDDVSKKPESTDATSITARSAATSSTNAATSGLGLLIYGKSMQMTAGRGVALLLASTLPRGHAYTITTKPISGNTEAAAYAYNGSTFRLIRYSVFSGKSIDESHIFFEDMKSGESPVLAVVPTTDAAVEVTIHQRKDIPLAQSMKSGTSRNVPITAVMDNSSVAGIIEAYNGVQALRDYGDCRRDGGGVYSICSSSDTPSTTTLLGYRVSNTGATVRMKLPAINFVTNSWPEHLWYDNHNGYDIGMAEGTPVYAPYGGVVSVTNDAYNRVDILYGNKWCQSFLHMKKDGTTYIKDGAIVAKGQRIGTVSYTGLGRNASHLHVSSWSNGCGSNRVDPYRLGIHRD